MRKKKGIKIFLGSCLVIASMTGMISGNLKHEVKASEAVSQSIHLGTSGICNPTEPKDSQSNWTGDYVYYGTYKNTPIKFRVLNGKETAYGGDSVFLDCDSVLEIMAYDSKLEMWGDTTDWSKSTLKVWLNDSKEGFLSNLSLTEQSAIMESKRDDHSNLSQVIGSNDSFNLPWVALTGEKVFALDAREASTPAYGYQVSDYGESSNTRIKEDTNWWMRSPCIVIFSNTAAANAEKDGAIEGSTANGKNNKGETLNIGASPALNVASSSVLFSTTKEMQKDKKLSSIQSAEDKHEWEFTLKDSRKTIQVGTLINKANVVTVPYTYTGDGVSQISVMITDKDRSQSDAKVLYYGALQTTLAKSGTGTFEMPTGLKDGYKVYVMAEDVNEWMTTDFASEPVEVKIPEPEVVKPQVAEKTEISKVKVSKIKVKTYSGLKKKPSITVTYQGKKLKKDTDYTVSYKNNIKVGTAKVIIKGRGNYTGTKTVTFKIKTRKKGSYAKGIYKVDTDGLKARAKASSKSKVKKVLKQGAKLEVVKVIKKKTTKKTYVWLKTKYKGKTYYVYAKYVI